MPIPDDPLKPLNARAKPRRAAAVAIQDAASKDDLPRVAAAGRGEIAEQILRLAFERGIRVREDASLAEMLVAIDIDSPIPTEAFMAVAEILSYVYRANGAPDPFAAVLADEDALAGDDAGSSKDARQP